MTFRQGMLRSAALLLVICVLCVGTVSAADKPVTVKVSLVGGGGEEDVQPFQTTLGKVQGVKFKEADIKPSDINPEALEEMDCITCHNRITHLVPAPEDMIDQMISQSLIAKDIPDIRRQALEVYSRPYDSVEAGLNALAGIENYYKIYSPEYYSENRAKIAAATMARSSATSVAVAPSRSANLTAGPIDPQSVAAAMMSARPRGVRASCIVMHRPEWTRVDVNICDGGRERSRETLRAHAYNALHTPSANT